MADLKTIAIVLKRVNYNESDRIVTFLTPEGRFSAITKGARKEKSKLAGGIEMFCLSKIVVHQRDDQLKTTSLREDEQFGILTSATLVEFYQNIISDLETLELASLFLKQINRLTHQISSAELFSLLHQVLFYLNQYFQDSKKRQLITVYFKLNLSRICGEEINIYYDRDNQKLEENFTYDWDDFDKVLIRREDQLGSINQNVIKLIRLILTTQLGIVLKVKNVDPYLPMLSYLAA